MSNHGMNSNSRNSNRNQPSLGPQYEPLDASHGVTEGYDSIRTPSSPVLLPGQKYEQLGTLNNDGGYEIPVGHDHTYEVPIQPTYLELQADSVKSSNIKVEEPVHHQVSLPLPRHVERAQANSDDKSTPASTMHCCQGARHSKTFLAVLIAILVLVILGLVGALIGVSVKPNQQDQNIATTLTFSLDQNNATTPTYPPAEITSSFSPAINSIAFEVVRTTTSAQQQQLFLDNVLINDGTAFQSGLFEAPADGVYCFHFTVGILAYKTCNASLTTNNIITSVIKTRSSIGLDTLARFDLFPLSSRQQVKLSIFDEQQDVYSNSLMETSWLGFRLDNIMSPFVAISAGSSRSVVMTANVDELAFNEIFVDTHKGWIEQTGCYTVPVSGYYFITYQASSLSNNTQVICIRVNGYLATIDDNSECVSMEASSNVTSQTISASLLVYLRENDNVSVACTYPNLGNCLLFSDNTYQVTMSAFLYQPTVGSVVAWSVARLNLFVFGEINPLEFNMVLVNEGLGWNQFEQKFVCPEAGVYYVYLMGHANSGPLQLTVVYNNNPLATLRNDNPHSDFSTVRSRALLIKLSVNDKVHISLTGGTYMVFFIGFKLF